MSPGQGKLLLEFSSFVVDDLRQSVKYRRSKLSLSSSSSSSPLTGLFNLSLAEPHSHTPPPLPPTPLSLVTFTLPDPHCSITRPPFSMFVGGPSTSSHLPTPRGLGSVAAIHTTSPRCMCSVLGGVLFTPCKLCPFLFFHLPLVTSGFTTSKQLPSLSSRCQDPVRG